MQIPQEGFLRLNQILGVTEVTEREAESNRTSKRGPRKARTAVAGVLPIKKSTWWAGVKSGRFPKPVKLGSRVAVWRVADIRQLLDSLQ